MKKTQSLESINFSTESPHPSPSTHPIFPVLIFVIQFEFHIKFFKKKIRPWGTHNIHFPPHSFLPTVQRWLAERNKAVLFIDNFFLPKPIPPFLSTSLLQQHQKCPEQGLSITTDPAFRTSLAHTTIINFYAQLLLLFFCFKKIWSLPFTSSPLFHPLLSPTHFSPLSQLEYPLNII